MRHITNRLVPDPSMSDAEYYHQRQANPGKPNVGKIYVRENAISRIGALCYIRQREAHHEHAAERFKTLYEHLYGSGTPPLDPSREPVDRSVVAHDSGMAAKLDRSGLLRQAREGLGKEAFDRVVSAIVLCIPAGHGAPRSESGRLNDRRVRSSVQQLLSDLDALSIVWGRDAKAA